MTWTIDIENIAGIRAGHATIEPGLNVVRGNNWQGKSSFIAAIETAIGTTRPLTEGQAVGTVVLETPAGTFHVSLTREDGRVEREGEPLLTDPYDVDRSALFACLGEDNALRAAVRRGDNLEAVLTRPLEFENIDERIAELTDERSRVETELAGAEEAANRRPQARQRIEELEATIDQLREQLPDDGAGDRGDGERGELSRVRAERDRVSARIERLEDSIERTEHSLADKREALSAIDGPPDDPAPEPTVAREELAALRRDAEVLQSVFSANQLVLEEDHLDLVTDVDRELTGETVTCWVCGAEADRDHIETHVGSLGDEVREVRAAIERVTDQVEALEARVEQRRQAERRQAELEDDIAALEATLEERRESLAGARDRLSHLEDQVESLSSSVRESVEAVAEVESEIRFRETELEEAREELATIESRAERVSALRDRRDELAEDVTALRNRKDELRQQTRRAFDDAIEDILDRFDTGFEAARLTPSFDLVVARNGREANLEALSEGELELLGFVAALAGHEAFDVAECLPALLVDATGSLADENRRRLMEYLANRVDYLVFTAHPEDTAVQAHEIDPRGWAVVSGDGAAVETD